MIGWELPPFNSGGLGVACLGLARALSEAGLEVLFVLPKKVNLNLPFLKLIFADALQEYSWNLYPYVSSTYNFPTIHSFNHSLVQEVENYARLISKAVQGQKFDLIHAHDWLCFQAGITAQRVSGRPFIAHIHATEFDRGGGNGINPLVYQMEKQGFLAADKIIANSHRIKRQVTHLYHIPSQKIEVVHNGLDLQNLCQGEEKILNHQVFKNKKIVLFVGRLTLQKGPDYFLQAAKKVLERRRDVLFVIAGSGDMEAQICQQVCELGIADKVIFAGFVRGKSLKKLYQRADVFVMPSVSDPFGIVALEAASQKTPVILSKQSGVAEVFRHSLQVDFWDIKELAAKILAVLEYRALKKELSQNGLKQAQEVTWEKAAQKVIQVYQALLPTPVFT